MGVRKESRGELLGLADCGLDWIAVADVWRGPRLLKSGSATDDQSINQVLFFPSHLSSLSEISINLLTNSTYR